MELEDEADIPVAESRQFLIAQSSCLRAIDNQPPAIRCVERADDLQHDLTKRLNRAIGQLNGVKDMIADNRYCGDVLVQLAAAESAVHRIAEIVLQDHMETCVVEQVRAGNVEVVDEAMRLIKKFM